jgi:hypothetical protein
MNSVSLNTKMAHAYQVTHLLDLKQKQANLWEARSSREQAVETSNQGNVRATGLTPSQ